MSDPGTHYLIEAEAAMKGLRLDKALTDLMPGHSRSSIQQWISQGKVLVDGIAVSQKTRLLGTETLEITVPEPQAIEWPAQAMDLNIEFEDTHILVLNKSAGCVVHPGAGNPDNTLLNGLLYHNPHQAKLPRAGIVHRLDKDTTGLMVVAKSEASRQSLIEQLQSREMRREYLAVCQGVMIAGEVIDQPIGRHRHDRLRMTVSSAGKPAITRISVVEKYREHCLIRAHLESGRTHQIRVHMSWRGFPITGDTLYCGRYRPPAGASQELIETLKNFGRQALHAASLSLVHPQTEETMTWKCDPPQDMLALIESLRSDLETNRY